MATSMPVLVRQDAGGAAGGWDFHVYIVGSGKRVPTNVHSVLYAGTLKGEKLVWADAHLLDVQYDIANIHEFAICGAFRRYRL